MYCRAQLSTSLYNLRPNGCITPTSPWLYVSTARAVSAKSVTFRHVQPSWGGSVGFIRGEQRCIYRLHAGRAGEGTHQPGVNAIHVVDVKAGQEPNGITVLKIHHADHTSGAERERNYPRGSDRVHQMRSRGSDVMIIKHLQCIMQQQNRIQ